MSTGKRYYWLKLKADFFQDTTIKFLRTLPEGDTLIIIYLKLQCMSLKNEGIVKHTGLFPAIEEEIALAIDEDIKLVKIVIRALLQAGAIEIWEDQTLYLTAMQELIGSETDAAQRVRKHRAHRNSLQCNSSETDRNTEIEQKKDIDKEIEEEIESKIVVPPDTYKSILNLFNDLCPSYSPLTKLTDKYKKDITNTFHHGYCIVDFQNAFKQMENSSFLKGNNQRQWQANFGWVIQHDNLQKVLDGNYKNPEVCRTPYNSFNNFPQRTYNMDELERKLLEAQVNHH